MKRKLAIWLFVELMLAIAVTSSCCIYRRATTLGVVAWRQNPTPENKAELDRQHRIDSQQYFLLGTVLFSVMAVITIPFVVSSAKRASFGPSKTLTSR